MTDKTTIELKIRKRGKDGWRKHIEQTEAKTCGELLDALVDKHLGETGSYEVSCKVNGGYGKNPDTGATYLSNFSGSFKNIYSTLKKF